MPELGAAPLQGPDAANRWWLYQGLSSLPDSITLICYLAYFLKSSIILLKFI